MTMATYNLALLSMTKQVSLTIAVTRHRMRQIKQLIRPLIPVNFLHMMMTATYNLALLSMTKQVAHTIVA